MGLPLYNQKKDCLFVLFDLKLNVVGRQIQTLPLIEDLWVARKTTKSTQFEQTIQHTTINMKTDKTVVRYSLKHFDLFLSISELVLLTPRAKSRQCIDMNHLKLPLCLNV